jgi:hypothetical protein
MVQSRDMCAECYAMTDVDDGWGIESVDQSYIKCLVLYD